jgi:uncharacterized membrane protein
MNTPTPQPAPNTTWTDQRIEILVGVMLRTGVMLAAAIVLTGGILYLAHASGPRPDYAHFHAEPAEFTHFSGIIHGVAALNPESVIMCIVGFLFERDRLYTAVSMIVLAILLYSLFLHK